MLIVYFRIDIWQNVAIFPTLTILRLGGLSMPRSPSLRSSRRSSRAKRELPEADEDFRADALEGSARFRAKSESGSGRNSMSQREHEFQPRLKCLMNL